MELNARAGNQEVVFVDVVSLANLPEIECPSTIRLYSAEKEEGERWKGFYYSTVRSRALGTFRGFEGLTKFVPGFVGWEVYATRIARLGPHHARCDVIEGCIKAVESVSHAEGEGGWHRESLDAIDLSTLRVVLHDQFAEVALDIIADGSFRLIDVAVDPFDL